MSLFRTLNKLGVLSAGRRPEWQTQTQTEGAPASPSAGVGLTGAMKTIVHLPIWEDAHRRTARVRIPSFDEATTYTVEIDGAGFGVSASDTDAVLTDFADELPTLEEVDEVVTVDLGEDEAGQFLLIQGRDEESDWELTVTADGGEGEIRAEMDPLAATARVWLRPGGTGDVPGQWVLANGGEFEVNRRGLTERVTTSGFSRIYIEVRPDAVDGDNIEVRPMEAYVGPGVME